MSDSNFSYFPPGKEDEFAETLKIHMENGGPNAVCARLMQEISPTIFKILNEEFEKDRANCMMGLIAFYVNISSNVILQTPFQETPSEFCELIKGTFIDFIDQSIPLLMNHVGKRENDI